MENIKDIIATNLVNLRNEKKMTQSELAEKAGMSRSHLSAIEAPNLVRSFSVDILFSIADALNVKASDLLENRIR